DMNVKESLERIRAKGIKNETINDCFVIDKERKLVGTLPIRELIINQEETLIKNIMTDNFEKVQADTDREFVADLFRRYDLSTMAVVDTENRLVGIITIDDIVDVIDQENTEDFQKMAAMEPSDKEYLKESVFALAKHRILWLLILMISATATGTIIRRYEDTLQSVVVLAAFIPMLMDTGGNAGSQSSTLIIRGLALGEIKTKDVWKILWKEFRVSIIVGITLAIVNFLRILYFDKIGFTMTLVVCLSLFATVVIAKVVGGILPIAAKKLKLDPAIMASPLITTIVDACALVIYFTMATALLHI
ncbi:MAG: magnesium transporter, partial [Fusobacterium sp.]